MGCTVVPPASYWERETRTVPRIDYAEWDALLRAHVRDGVVDYPELARSPRLARVMRVLRKARFTAETTGDERLAFWLNAYNAAAIAAVVDGQSPATLLGRNRFFRRTLHRLGGEAITLWDLENARIRSVGDPRIHFAIVCASASCPRLASEAFVPARLDEQLERLARAFVNDPARNSFDAEAREAHISKIFDWFAEDFIGSDGSVAAFLARYHEDPSIARSLREDTWELDSLPYDWSLNGPPPPPPPEEE